MTKELQVTVPRRIECQADVDEAVESFTQAINHYLITHSLGEFKLRYEQPITHLRILPRNSCRLINDQDVDRAVQLILDPRSLIGHFVPFQEDTEERIRSSIPFGLLMNRYERLLGQLERVAAERDQRQAPNTVVG